LPHTSEKVKRLCDSCQVCAKIKPCFYWPKAETLVKASSPWERLAMDFKRPVKGPCPYLLVILDEYSRYLFVYPCKSLSSEMVIKCLLNLFCIFGFPRFIYSDRRMSFMSKETKAFLNDHGIYTSYTSPYHPKKTRNASAPTKQFGE